MATTYVYSENLLMQESYGTITMQYQYVARGAVGVWYQNSAGSRSRYFHRRNLQGDVTAIVDASGTVVAKYSYDAWGNSLDIWQEVGYTIGDVNPLRYRGYYWDAETNYYFLQTRYYNPEWRRFLNADVLFIAGDDALNGSNMYAYCNGNPVMRVDPSGKDSAFELFVTVVNGFITAAPQIFSFIKLVTIDFGGWFFEQDWTWVGDIYKGLGSAFDSLFANGIVQPITDSFGLLRGFVNTVFDDFIPGVRDLIFSIDFDAIGKNIQGAVNAISNVVTPLWNGFLDWIRNI